MQDVLAALDQLPEEQKSLLLLVGVEDLSYDDAARRPRRADRHRDVAAVARPAAAAHAPGDRPRDAAAESEMSSLPIGEDDLQAYRRRPAGRSARRAAVEAISRPIPRSPSASKPSAASARRCAAGSRRNSPSRSRRGSGSPTSRAAAPCPAGRVAPRVAAGVAIFVIAARRRGLVRNDLATAIGGRRAPRPNAWRRRRMAPTAPSWSRSRIRWRCAPAQEAHLVQWLSKRARQASSWRPISALRLPVDGRALAAGGNAPRRPS